MDKLSERITNRPLVDENEIETGSYEITEEEINEVAQLEAALKEIRNVANEVHEENTNSLKPPNEDTRIVPLWVIDKCSKALNDERDWLEALKAGGEDGTK